MCSSRCTDAVADHDEDRAERGLSCRLSGVISSSADGHQEAGAEGDEVAQVALDAASAHQHQAAGDIGERGQDAQEHREFEHACYLSDPLCRMCITSPSCTTYSLPSRRSVPRARAAASLPASSRLSQRMVSARMK